MYPLDAEAGVIFSHFEKKNLPSLVWAMGIMGFLLYIPVRLPEHASIPIVRFTFTCLED
jgi:hypothetical protein